MKKKYLISGLIVSIILLVVFFIKNIFPFGNNFIAWGDMHSQILAIYYHFYDIVYNGKSIFLDLTSATASNFLANASYYIISPFTLIILLFKRVDIPNAVSIIVLLKMSLSAITCNYFIDKKFNKISDFYKVFLSVLYALSTYNLSLYIITGWMDIVYLFPLIIYGLLELLDHQKPKMLIITLILSIIFNFYLSLMVLLFIFIGSLIYLIVYKKEDLKKDMSLLGLSVLVSILSSSVVLLPTIIQILSSARMGFSFTNLLTAKTGPVIDKLMFLTSTGFMVACIILILFKFKKNKKFLTFFVPLLALYTVPIIIEPINKMLHFGSYVYYPLRYGFILIFILLIGACYYLNNTSIKMKSNKLKTLLISILTIGINGLIILITYKYYGDIQTCIDKLSFSYNHKIFFIMALLTFLNLISYFVILKFTNISKKNIKILLLICLVTFVSSQSLLYISIDKDEGELHQMYDNLNEIYNYNSEVGYHYKKNENILFENFGMVSDKQSQDFFTSLIDNNIFINYQILGYDTLWMNTSSSGSNMFIDGILANKYELSKKELNSELYELINKYDDISLYESKLNISKGYLLDNNISLEERDSSFKNTNNIYRSLTNTNEDIFIIYDDFKLNNVEFKNDNLVILDSSKEASIEIEKYVSSKSIVYFEYLGSRINSEKVKVNKMFDLYINDKYQGDYPTKENSGTINLGIYENSFIKIKLVLKDTNILNISKFYFGLLDYNKTINFFINNSNKIDIEYLKDCISINYKSDSDKILFIPISYLDGMKATLNDKRVEIIKVFDTFVGIKLNKGNNNIKIYYETPGLKLGLLITFIGFVLSVLLIKYSSKIIGINILNKLCFIAYIIVYILMLLVIYIIPGLIFIKSFV